MRSNAARHEEGFVLVVALLALVLLGAVVTAFNTSLRSHLRDVRAITARAEVESLADAGVNIAILDLIAAREDRTRTRRFPINGAALSCQDDRATIEISVGDEAGLVDLNAAGEQLLEALFVGAGAGADSARAFANALIDFRDVDSTTRPHGAEAAEYRAAGLDHGPKNAPFDAVEELSRVLGIDASLIEKLQPFLTVHSGLAGIDPDAAPPELLSILSRGTAREGSEQFSMDAASQRARFRRSLPQFVAVSARQRFTIRATARLPSAAFVREAVVEVTGSRSRAFAIRAWRQGTVTTGHAMPDRDLPAC